jgi:hypothetical protein
VTISLSGNETVSYPTSVDVGDTFSMDYTIKSSNETSCITTTVSFEPEAGISQPIFNNQTLIHPQLIFTNRTLIGPHLTRINGTSFKASEKGAIMVTYYGCSNPCKGKTSISSSYSLQTELFQSYMRTALLWSPFLAVTSIVGLIGGLVGGYYLARNRLLNLLKKGKWSPSTSGVSPLGT